MNNERVKQMASVALLLALIVVLQAIGGIIPPIGGFSISLVLIPIVMGAVMFGPKASAFLGAAFGLMAFINCVTGADPGGAMVFQANPYLCFLVVMAKGILAGIASGFVYRLLKNINEYLAAIAAAIICPVVNTGVFLVCMFAFYIDVLSKWANGGNVMGYVLTGIILVNFVPELIINILFGSASVPFIKYLNKKK